jgi:hypothetical protein
MKIDEKELLVRSVKMDAAGRFVVIGIPNNGKSISVGDTFTTRYDAPQTVDDILNERPRPAPLKQSAITLTVVAIDSMRQQVIELPHGVTGALQLTGAGMEGVTPNCFLMT